MAYFDAFTAHLFRTDIHGRRLICPLGRRAYAVSADDERRIKRAVAFFYAAMLLLVVVVASVAMPNWLWIVLLLPLFLGAYFLLMAFLTRSLAPIEEGWAGLPPVTLTKAVDAFARATGRRTLWTLTVLSSAMTALGVCVRLWWSAAFFALCTAVLALYAWRSGRPS